MLENIKIGDSVQFDLNVSPAEVFDVEHIKNKRGDHIVHLYFKCHSNGGWVQAYLMDGKHIPHKDDIDMIDALKEIKDVAHELDIIQVIPL